jgi:hypothetical protein
MEKKRLIVNIDNLPEGVLEAIRKKYPHGYNDYVIKVPKGISDHFYAITVDTENASYLVKVNVRVDSIIDNDEKEEVDHIDIERGEEPLTEEPDDLEDIDL